MSDNVERNILQHKMSERKSSSGELKASETVSQTSSIGLDYYRSSSYGDELGYFLKSKAAVQEERNRIIFSMRDKFGEYESSAGILEHEGYFKESERGIYSIQFSNDGRRLVVGFGSGTVLVFGTKSHQLYFTVFEGKECGFPVNCIRFHPIWQHKFLVCSTDTITLCSSLKNTKNPVIKEKGSDIYSIDFNFVGNILASVGKDAVVRIYDTETFQVLKEYKKEYTKLYPDEKTAGFHTKRLFAVRFSPDDSNLFVTGGWDKLVKVWDERHPTGCVGTIVGPHIFGESIDLKCGTILTGSWTAKKTIQLWDIRKLDHELLHCIPQNTPPLKEGYFIVGLRFFAGDSKADAVVLASMTSKSFDMVSLRNNVILHSFMTGNVVVGNHSHETKVSYGGMLQTLRIADFYLSQSQLDEADRTTKNN